MMNSKYNQIKSLWKNKQILTEAAMDWKQSYGCFPSVSEFAEFINECLEAEVVDISGLDQTRELNENDISWFANKLVVLSEDAADKFAAMTDAQIEDFIKGNKGAEEKVRKLRAEGKARKTGGTATAEAPKAKPEAPKTEAPKAGPSATKSPFETGAPTDPKAREAWEKASREERTRGWASDAAKRRAAAGKTETPKAEAPKTAPKAEAPKATPSASSVPPVDKLGKFLRGAGKFALAVPPVAVAAEAGQQLFGMGAEALGAGSAGKFSSETAGAYYGEKVAIKAVDAGLKKAGFKPTGFKPSVSGAALMVAGQKAGEAIGGDWSPAVGAMSGALVGEVGERAVMKTAAAKAAKEAAEKVAAKTIGKSLAKKIPGVGLVAGGVLAAERASGGDWLGAAGEALSGLASTVPGVGTAVSAGVDTLLAGKDIAAETERAEDEAMEKAQAEARKKENEKLKAAMKSPTSQAASFERALYGGAPLREGWVSALAKAVGKVISKEAGEAAVKTAAKEAEEAVAKTAAKEVGGTATAASKQAPVAPKPEPKPFAEPPVAKPQTIEIPTTHPIVKVETPAPSSAKTGEIVKVEAPAPTKTGEIVKAETKIETRPLKSPESTPSAAQTLPANKTKTPEQVVTDIVNKVKTILKSEPAPKPKPDDIVKPKADDIVKPKPKPDDIVKPKVDDIVKPKVDDTPKPDDIVKPKVDDIVKPKVDDTPKPKGDTPPVKGDVPPIKGDVPPIKPRLPGGGDTPQVSTSLAAEPEVPLELAPGERYGVRKRAATYDPFRRMFTTQSVYVSEGKLSPKESLQRKLKKQKYKVLYLQDGKKVEVFASSIRGVRRVIFGKKQYRVHNTSGSDVTGYFKKLLGQ